MTLSCLPFAVNAALKVSITKAESVEPGDENCDNLLLVCSLCANDINYRMLCFVKKALERIMRYTLISHTNVCPIQGRSTLRGFECFRNRQSGVSFRAGHQANRPAVNRTMPGCFIDNFFSSLAVPCYFPEAKSLLKYLTSLFKS